MTLVPIESQVDDILKTLAAMTARVEGWKNLAAEAKAEGVAAKMNGVKSALWYLHEADRLFEELDDTTGVIEKKIAKARERAVAAQAKKRRER